MVEWKKKKIFHRWGPTYEAMTRLGREPVKPVSLVDWHLQCLDILDILNFTAQEHCLPGRYIDRLPCCTLEGSVSMGPVIKRASRIELHQTLADWLINVSRTLAG